MNDSPLTPEEWEDLEPPEPHTDIFYKEKHYRAELDLNQSELVQKRAEFADVSEVEWRAVENAALAIIEYKTFGSVDKCALDYVDEVTYSVKRCVQLLNIAIPLARSISRGEWNGRETEEEEEL